jgi:hypothetical protein
MENGFATKQQSLLFTTRWDIHRTFWEKEVDEYAKRKTFLADNVQTVYSLVWGQCTDAMRQKIKALPTYEHVITDGDGLALLKAIKNLIYSFQSQKGLSHALHESKRQFYFCAQQGRHTTTTTSTCMEKFQNIVDIIKLSDGLIANNSGVLSQLADEKRINMDLLSDENLLKLKKEAQEQNLAVAFLLSSNRRR